MGRGDKAPFAAASALIVSARTVLSHTTASSCPFKRWQINDVICQFRAASRAALGGRPGGGGRASRQRRRRCRGGRRRSGSWCAGRRGRDERKHGGWARRLRAATWPNRCAGSAGARAAPRTPAASAQAQTSLCTACPDSGAGGSAPGNRPRRTKRAARRRSPRRRPSGCTLSQASSAVWVASGIGTARSVPPLPRTNGRTCRALARGRRRSRATRPRSSAERSPQSPSNPQQRVVTLAANRAPVGHAQQVFVLDLGQRLGRARLMARHLTPAARSWRPSSRASARTIER
jgi:hypothetical protein